MSVPDDAERWLALGFAVHDGVVVLPDVRIVLGAPGMSAAIEGVSELAGLAVEAVSAYDEVASHHPNGALGLDHLVGLTPDFDATAAELDRIGLPFKRIRDAGGFRQGFRRLGGPILEIVESDRVDEPIWWGLTVTLPDLSVLPDELTTEPKAAVQPGRLIATATSPGTPLAFITPES